MPRHARVEPVRPLPRAAPVPAERRQPFAAGQPAPPGGTCVVYLLTRARRPTWNHALQRAIGEAEVRGLPLLLVDFLPVGDRYATARSHFFALQGMQALAAYPWPVGVVYRPLIESAHGSVAPAIAALGRLAAWTVVDHPVTPADRELLRRLRGYGLGAGESVDADGLLPLQALEPVFPTAYAFRRAFQRVAARHLAADQRPAPAPAAGARLPPPPPWPDELGRAWPAIPAALCRSDAGGDELLELCQTLPIDHSVVPVETRGGWLEAGRVWRDFLQHRLDAYVERRNHPDDDATSGIAPYLRHGHISIHQIFDDLMARQGGFDPERLPKRATGRKEGWWGVDATSEAFLDQAVIWREVGRNFSARRDDVDDFASLPHWARTTLQAHAGDKRPFSYDLARFAAADTHDPLWNSAQRQLRREGRLHNYLRMLWGKKILEWSASPEDALATMLELNNRYALDGCDPNSSSGIMWVLGRYDRPWGPQRPIFGSIRYMSSDATRRKLRVRRYLERYGG